MEKLTDKTQINRTILLFSLTYMVSYMTRINFGAVLAAIVEDTGMTKTMLSAAVTGSAITYGMARSSAASSATGSVRKNWCLPA